MISGHFGDVIGIIMSGDFCRKVIVSVCVWRFIHSFVLFRVTHAAFSLIVIVAVRCTHHVLRFRHDCTLDERAFKMSANKSNKKLNRTECRNEMKHKRLNGRLIERGSERKRRKEKEIPTTTTTK